MSTTTTDADRVGAVAGHTPGRWRATPYSSVIGAGVMVQPDPARNSWVLAMVQGQSGPEAEANARLIAAAPDMLAALRAVQRLDYFQEHNALARQVAEAIARATGATP